MLNQFLSIIKAKTKYINYK